MKFASKINKKSSYLILDANLSALRSIKYICRVTF